ncbi:MAG: chromosome segregation protein SMC [Clostridiales bacterium]|nr:MAG: chromosome segregation protein SMC [Clostridiales bacterium]
MLKNVEIKGFKSFADQTSVNFDDGITCIVGPNGSGKSNITDAFRWVLGEQRQKTLRAGKMSDVIFNGTTKREPLSYAKVSLTFDNTKGYLPIEYSDVKVTRKLYRSGESSYEINGNSCRLKDVKNLFADTGIGVEGYSIIGQGRIEKLLSSDKADRRLIFEEASGIAKLRIKKEDAERKLDRAKINIERIEDIINELEERVEPLRIQMEDAKLYNKLNKELKEIEITMFLSDIDTFTNKIVNYENDLEKIYKDSEFKINNILSLKQEFSNLKVKLDDLNSEREEIDFNLTKNRETDYKLSSNIEKEKEKLSFYNEKKADLILELDLLEKNLDFDVKKNLELEIKRLKEDYDKTNLLFESAKSDIDYQNFNLTEKYEKLALSKADLRNKENNVSNLKIDITKLSAKKESINITLGRLNEELKNYLNSSKKNTEDLKLKTDEKSEFDKKLDTENKNKLDLEMVIADKETLLSNVTNSIYDINLEKQKVKATINTLQYNIDNHSVFVSASKDVLLLARENNDKNIYGSIADIIDVDFKYILAVEQILGTRIENIVCKNYDDAKKYIEILKNKKMGRATFMPLDNLKVKDKIEVSEIKGLNGHILDFIKVDDEYESAIRYLLYNVFVSENMTDAKNAIDKLPLGSKIVTVDGEVINIGGSISGGHKNNLKSGILSDKNNLSNYKKELESLNIKLSSLETQKKNITDNIKAINSDIIIIKEKIDDYIRSVHKIEIEIDAKRNLISNEYKAIEDIKENLEIQNKDLSDVGVLFDNANSELKLDEIEINKLLSIIDILDNELGESNKKLNKRIEENRAIENELLEIKYELENKNREYEDKNNLISEREKRKEILADDINKIKENILIINSVISESEEEKKSILDSLKSLTLSLNDIDFKINDLKAKIQNVSNDIKQSENEVADMKDVIYDFKLKIARFETKKEEMIKQIWETYNMSLLEADEFKVDTGVKASKSYREELKAKIASLGSINTLAIEEYEKVNERYEFLNTQKKDLIDTHKKLTNIVLDLNKDMSEKFIVGMKSINKNFASSFSGLFRGGSASIELSDYDNVLDAEILINAQPPGKKLQSLELLSGGEKALTAIAILFAILKDKPSPFCILDEIEAALDDNNIYLFSSYLKDFANESQFIVITHRKATMEIAKSLFGVTMKEKGISSIFSMSLENLAYN